MSYANTNEAGFVNGFSLYRTSCQCYHVLSGGTKMLILVLGDNLVPPDALVVGAIIFHKSLNQALFWVMMTLIELRCF